MIRILIVDDQRIVREGIKILLEEKSEIQIVGDASEAKEALTKVESLQPDIVFLDINLPGIDGFAIFERINKVSPHVKIIMLSSYEDKEYIEKAIELGAKGYLLKNASSEELEWSIKLVYQGYSAIKSELLEKHLGVIVPEADINKNARTNPNSKRETVTAKGDRRQAPPVASAVATVSRTDNPKSNQKNPRLSKETPAVRYPNYPKPKSKPNSRFHSVTMLKIKRTIASFEFKILVLAILFCMGFLIFIALS